MNIFVLEQTPKEAAQYHCDKHVVKMILESAQLLSTAHRVLDGVEYTDDSSGRKIKRWRLPDDYRENSLYKASHINHPCGIWARQTTVNYQWLYDLFVELGKEYTFRYGKEHLTISKLKEVLSIPPDNISKCRNLTAFAQAMPDDCKVSGDAVTAYRNYYRKYKSDFAVWTKRNKPYWY